MLRDFEIQLRFGFHIFFDVWDSTSLGFPEQIWFFRFNLVGIWSQIHLHLHLHMSIHFIFIVVSIAIVAIFIFTCIFICRSISSLSLYPSASSFVFFLFRFFHHHLHLQFHPHLHVHLLSSSPPLPPLHRSGVGLSPTHHHHSDKYNECSARIETVSRTHGIIHPHLLNVARLEA